MSHKRDDLLEATAQEALDVSGGAVAEPDPDDFRREAAEDAQSVEILVFRDEHKLFGAGM